MIHLDTSFVIDLIRESTRDKHGPAMALLKAHLKEECGISVFVQCELLGARRPVAAEKASA